MATKVWTLGTFDFIAQGAIPRSLSLRPGWQVNPILLPLQDGAVVPSTPKSGPQSLNLSGMMQAANATALRVIVDALIQVLRSGSQQLKVFNDRYADVVAQANGLALEYGEGPGLQTVAFSLDLLAPDGYWVSITLDSTSYSTNATPSITNGGNIATPLNITVTAPAGGLTQFVATNTTASKTLTWDGSLTVGQTLIIDMDDISITEAGVVDMSGFTGVFWDLSVGANSLSFSSTPTGATVTVTKRDRWG